MSEYEDFLATKRALAPTAGIAVDDADISRELFPFQRDLTRWALRKGRAAIFADTGLGKTRMQLEWARLSGERTLILAPLSVARQTVHEAEAIGVEIVYARRQEDAGQITITNYEMVDHFDPSEFGAVVLDESSILKALDGKTRQRLTELFARTPYRLCCTATPAPNDIAEIANHAEFLGVMSRAEMLAMFFVHDDDGWRLKGHAEQSFYRWLASWGMSVRKPSDLGYSDEGYDLPTLTIEPLFIESDYRPEGMLFSVGLKGIGERSAVRKETLAARVETAVRIVRESWEAAANTTVDATSTIARQSSSESASGASRGRRKKTSAGGNTREIGTSGTAPGNGNSSGSTRSSGSASPSPTTSHSSPISAGAVPSAVVSQPLSDASISTMSTAAGQSEGSSAIDAINSSDASETMPTDSEQPDLSQRPRTSKEQWILWCGLNEEQDAVARAFGDECISVYGSLTPEEKTRRIEAWLDGAAPVLVTKVAIAGFGLNLQCARNMAFVGLNDSWESYYQAIRRCWRFGQTRPVNVHIVLSDVEQDIYHNVMRKEAEAATMAESLIEHVREFERTELAAPVEEWEYETDEAVGDGYRLMLGDSAERLRELDAESIDLSVYSPPFRSLYTYSPTERDLGNSRTTAEFNEHYGYIIDELLRVTKPGRHTCVHVQQLTTTLATHGVIGMSDFRGDTIRAYVERGWTYHGEVCIDKDPQAQAIRTHSKGLLFVQLRKDSTWSRPALADYILIFRKSGENAVPVSPDITNDEWIEWARPIWYGIKESDTLNVQQARDERDERHIAPLQLGTIERCIRLWSNPGETVLSPFAGIGSEGYEAIRRGRQFVGIELKRQYWNVARRNLERAVALREGQMAMFGEDAAT